jgi:hypothetical protein
MTTLAHIAGVPVEELAGTLVPAAAVWVAALRHLFSRLNGHRCLTAVRAPAQTAGAR